MDARCDNVFTIEFLNAPCKNHCLMCVYNNTCFLAYLNINFDFTMSYSEGESNE